MTPRQKQERFRSAVKEYLTWGFLFSASFLMIVHWIVIGYKQ